MISDMLNMVRNFSESIDGGRTYLIDAVDRSFLYQSMTDRKVDGKILEMDLESFHLAKKEYTKIDCPDSQRVFFIKRLESHFYFGLLLEDEQQVPKVKDLLDA